MAGRKPKPTALKKLEGNPGKRKLNTKEPVPGKGMPDCPKWLLPEAKKEWKRLLDNQHRETGTMGKNHGTRPPGLFLSSLGEIFLSDYATCI